MSTLITAVRSPNRPLQVEHILVIDALAVAGVSDLFLVNTQSPLAQLYNNISVNENHHCACVWKMLSQPELNITENLALEQWRELRSLVVKIFMGATMKVSSSAAATMLGCLSWLLRIGQ